MPRMPKNANDTVVIYCDSGNSVDAMLQDMKIQKLQEELTATKQNVSGINDKLVAVEKAAVVQEGFKTNVAVGNIAADSNIEKGTKLSDLLKNMLSGEQPIPASMYAFFFQDQYRPEV